MRATSAIMFLTLACLLAACDKADPAEGLPGNDSTPAPAPIEVPKLEDSMASTHAKQTANHRWVGSAQAKHHVELAPGMSGVIASIAVNEGDTVEAGQQVFRIEGAEVKLAVSQAEAAVASAQLAFDEAEREAERTRKLAERGSVGTANLERAEAGVEAARAGVKQAKAAASLARSRTGDLTVETPISGIVTSKLLDVGEVATMMPPSIVLVIDDLSIIEVRVRVPELKLREVNQGSLVDVYFPALDYQIEVPITRIGNAVDPRTRTIELIIEVANPDMRIKSGMSVEVGLGGPDPKPSESAKPSESDKPSESEKPDESAKPDEPVKSPPATAASQPDSRNPTAMIVPPAKAG